MLLGHRVRTVAVVSFVAGVAASAAAQSPADAARVVARAATSLGGADQLRAVRTIRLRGYGQEAYQDGGSKITTELTAPEKMTNLTAYERVIDLPAHRRFARGSAGRAVGSHVESDVAVERLHHVAPLHDRARGEHETAR
jgi:hypothetical protein